MNIDKNWIAGSAPLLILSLLKEKECYGYELIKLLKERSNHIFELKEGTLYPILHRLENEGFIVSMNKEVNGRTRRYYKISEQGLRQLAQEEKQWNVFFHAVNQVLTLE